MDTLVVKDVLLQLFEVCLDPKNCTGVSKYFTQSEVKEAFKKFGCNTTENFGLLLDTVVEENFMGPTTISLRKDTIGMVEYLKEVYKPQRK